MTKFVLVAVWKQGVAVRRYGLAEGVCHCAARL